ncbi:ABC transporter substrate-binding protein [Micrococcus luteus]
MPQSRALSRGVRLSARVRHAAARPDACAGGTGGSGSDSASGAASGSASAAESDKKVTLYSGRSEDLVQPILDEFTTRPASRWRSATTRPPPWRAADRGGEGSPADVFLSQDAGALGAVAKEGLFTPLAQETLDRVPETYRDDEGDWVGLTGRVRVLAYNEEKSPRPTSRRRSTS